MFQNSYVLWRGPSLYNDEEIAVVLTGLTVPSANRKTGVIIQSWIIPTASRPTDAIKNGDDAAVCGECPLRGKSCYVNLVGVNQIYENLDTMPMVDSDLLGYIKKYSGLGLRLGAYGDPVFAPLAAWMPLIKASQFVVGYTHQWRDCDQRWKHYCQASVETVQGAKTAHRMGWSTYRIRLEGEPIMKSETVCINQTNKFIKCNTCRLCNGHKNIVADLHGAAFKVNHFKQLYGTEKIKTQLAVQ